VEANTLLGLISVQCQLQGRDEMTDVVTALSLAPNVSARRETGKTTDAVVKGLHDREGGEGGVPARACW